MVCLAAVAVIVAVCLCRRRRISQKVEFEVFTNENVSSKDTKAESTNATNPLPIIEKDLNDISKEDSIDTSNSERRKRRRKKDRITHNREPLKDEKEPDGEGNSQQSNVDDELCI